MTTDEALRSAGVDWDSAEIAALAEQLKAATDARKAAEEAALVATRRVEEARVAEQTARGDLYAAMDRVGVRRFDASWGTITTVAHRTKMARGGHLTIVAEPGVRMRLRPRAEPS